MKANLYTLAYAGVKHSRLPLKRLYRETNRLTMSFSMDRRV